MRLTFLAAIFILCFYSLRASGQDTLPKFQVINSNGKVFVAFYNPYSSALQVNIERSFDSTRNFSTVYALSEPREGTVSFTDVKATSDKMFYRIFIQLRGSYSFTPSQQPVPYVQVPASIKIAQLEITNGPGGAVVNGRRPQWEPSQHIYTDEYGNVKVTLPPPGTKKYLVKFFDDQEHLLFELTDFNDLPLTIDKENFLHAGWFNFEWYADGVIQEKNKFLLSKDN